MIRRLLYLPEPGSELARDIDALHYFVIATTMAGATLVSLVALAFIVRFRARAPGPYRTRRVHLSLKVEAAVILALLGLFLAWWVIGFRQYVALAVPPRQAISVHVVAKQWMWEFAYPGGGSSLHELYLPVGRPVKLHLTSRDVVHSFYVPAFRVKMDAVPGLTTTVWLEPERPGRYPIYCAEYCGTGHSVMRGELVVLGPGDYERWLDGRAAPLAAIGRDVAARRGCLQCHSLDGSRRTGPSFLELYGSVEVLADGSRVRVDEGYITDSMMDPNAKVVAGYEPVMPSYRGAIEPGETAALIELLRSLSSSELPR